MNNNDRQWLYYLNKQDQYYKDREMQQLALSAFKENEKRVKQDTYSQQLKALTKK